MSTAIPRKIVQYQHHARDADGDIIFYFLNAQDRAPEALRQSSPILALRPLPTAVIDRFARGDLGQYVIITQNSEYQVQLSRERARHLAGELRLVSPAGQDNTDKRSLLSRPLQMNTGSPRHDS